VPDIARSAVEKPVEMVEVGGAETLGDSATDARQDGKCVRAGHIWQRWCKIDDDRTIQFDDQAGPGQTRSPVAAHRGHVNGAIDSEQFMGLRLGSGARCVVGQEPGMSREFDDRQQTAGSDRGRHLSESAIRIRQVMQRA
jgi:hypothetical protein